MFVTVVIANQLLISDTNDSEKCWTRTENKESSSNFATNINPIQDGGGGKGGAWGKKFPAASFSAVTSTNIEIRPQKLFDF